jgi:hypothetical protein
VGVWSGPRRASSASRSGYLQVGDAPLQFSHSDDHDFVLYPNCHAVPGYTMMREIDRIPNLEHRELVALRAGAAPKPTLLVPSRSRRLSWRLARDRSVPSSRVGLEHAPTVTDPLD